MSARRMSGRDPMDDMPLHVGDWLTSETVRMLGLAGEAVYLRLLMMQWKNEADGIPNSEKALRVLVGASPKIWGQVWPLIAKHFPVDPDGRRRNVRLSNERAYMLERRERRRGAGAMGGQKTAQQRSSNAGSNAGSKRAANVQQKCSPSPSPSPTTSIEVVEQATPPLLDRFTDARHRDAYLGAHRSVRNARAFDATLESMADGMGGPGGRPCSWHQLGTAILEAQAAGRDLTPQTLRNFAAKVPTLPVVASVKPWDRESAA